MVLEQVWHANDLQELQESKLFQVLNSVNKDYQNQVSKFNKFYILGQWQVYVMPLHSQNLY